MARPLPEVDHPYGKDLAADLANLTALSDAMTRGPAARLGMARERVHARRMGGVARSTLTNLTGPTGGKPVQD